MDKTYYKGQALAIVMVVLVVASIIGIALFSRMTKDRRSVINQQDSASAQEQADAILNLFLGVDIDALESKLRQEEDWEDFDSTSSSDDLKTYLTGLGIGIDANSLGNFELCEGSGSSVRVSIGFTDENDVIEVQPGSSRVYYLDGATFNEDGDCNMEVILDGATGYSIFVEKIVNNNGNEEMNPSCVGTGCDSIDSQETDFEYVIDDWEDDSKIYNLREMVDNGVSEIRFLPIVGVLSVSEDVPDCIIREFRYSKVVAEVNCNGSYRAKEMYIPGSGSLGYPTLFDYVIYDTGSFIP
jgi:hypothetical protein